MSLMSGRTRAARRRRGVAALALAAAALAVVAVPALAHQTITIHADGSYAVMLNNHTFVYGCDEHSDGNRAYIRRVANGGTTLDPVWDPDGAGGECGGTFIDLDNLESYNICVQNEGCADPVYRREF